MKLIEIHSRIYPNSVFFVCCRSEVLGNSLEMHRVPVKAVGKVPVLTMGAAAYQLGNTSSRTITEVKQR